MNTKPIPKPEDLVLIDGSKPTSAQINFLSKTRLPLISMIDPHDKSSFITMESQKKIVITLQSKFHGQDPEIIKIPKGALFFLAEIRTREKSDRLVRLMYENLGKSPESIQTMIHWNDFLHLKRNHYILPFEVYKK